MLAPYMNRRADHGLPFLQPVRWISPSLTVNCRASTPILALPLGLEASQTPRNRTETARQVSAGPNHASRASRR